MGRQRQTLLPSGPGVVSGTLGIPLTWMEHVDVQVRVASSTIVRRAREIAAHPTSVGKAEVAAKRKEWQQLDNKKRKELLASHWFPGVLGPKNKVYIVDHHHPGLALLEERVRSVPVLIQRDFSWLEPAVFWRTMEFNRWAHPYDEHGTRIAYDAIPANLGELQDDPYRTLAARVRVAGGCSKDATPYAEFLWADFYRRRVKLSGDKPTARQLEQAMLLAHSQDAAYLPGWSGAIA